MPRTTNVSPKKSGTSFRLRTAIFLFFVVISVGLAIGATLRFGTRVALENEIDLLLEEDAEEISQVLQATSIQVSDMLEIEWNRRASIHELHHWFIRIIQEDDVVLWESIGIPNEAPPVHSLSIAGPLDWKNYRIIQRQLATPDKKPAIYLQVGTGLDNLNRDLWLLDRLLALTLLSLCLIGPLSAWILAGHLLEPLGALTVAAERLELTNAGGFLPLRGTRDELDRLAETINSLLGRVRRELQQREDWLANSAHQLRSPLAAITCNVEVVANRTQEGPSRTMLDSVLDECAALTMLVNKLLLLSEADSDRIQPKHQKVDLARIVRQACEIYEGLAISHQLELQASEIHPCIIEGNENYLRHVVQNLIDNAIKYTPPGGHVTVGLQVVEENVPNELGTSAYGQLIVADTGSGIAESDLEKVTERFFRADSGRNPMANPRGTGLGLSICQAIVQGHRGRLTIKSKPGEGTTVFVDFPLFTSSHV